ncbi:MAG TPA: ThuA domain-containing protein [Terriglobia bacterium]|nr:ThuA domain-containing protein [Terriglobia bacterium]
MRTPGAVTRRQLVRSAGALALSGSLVNSAKSRALASPATNAPGPASGPRVLALVGDRFHAADYIRTALTRLFRELNLPVDFTISFDRIDAALLANYRLFVIFRDGLNWPNGYLGPDAYPYASGLENPENWPKEQYEGWITEEQGKAIKDFVEAGNGLYAYHNSSNVSVFSRNFREVMGGEYIGHPALRPFKVSVANPAHPITQGVKDFIVNDEQHFVTYDKDPRYVILRSENIDGLRFEKYGTASIGGWAYDYGKGRVVFTAVGHTLHALWQPEYYKLQKNAVRWLLKLS